jgi:3'(2'), 5'-bisphosphate nucleotidase
MGPADQALLEKIAIACREAGEAIMAVRGRGFAIERKGDLSPVTEADHAAEAILLRALADAAPDIPVIAEEEVAAGRIPAHGDTYFLVDPLDGTKEFVRGGDDFTVNVGLIVAGAPVLGVVLEPVDGRMHAGIAGQGAWTEDVIGNRGMIATRPRADALVAVASRSHFNQATSDYLDALCPGCGHVGTGSSLKFCILAEGRADIYPRLSPTSEWDTAAGHAVLLAAGGRCDGPDGAPLRYGKTGFLNRAFVATGGWAAPACAPYLIEFGGGGDLPQGV